MTFEVEVNGRSRSVAVEAAGPGRFRVTIDGQVHLVDAARIGEFGLSLMIDGHQPASRALALARRWSGSTAERWPPRSTADGGAARETKADPVRKACSRSLRRCLAGSYGFWSFQGTKSPSVSRSWSSKR
jgi:hypothetical protein